MKISSLTSSPSRRSMTGLPATLSIGLGTRWVLGRRRVPFPASGMITCMSASSVAVLEPDEVVELRRRCFEHVAVHDGLDLVNESRRNVHRFAGLERAGDELLAGTGPEDQLAPEHVHGLVFHVVILETQDVPRLHVQDLADVAIGAGPDELIPPWLLHSVRHIGHATPPWL